MPEGYLTIGSSILTPGISQESNISLHSRSARIGIPCQVSKKKKAVSAIQLSAYYKRPRYCQFLQSRDTGSGLARFNPIAPASHRQGKAMKQFLLLS
jgi:hypothetical protein